MEQLKEIDSSTAPNVEVLQRRLAKIENEYSSLSRYNQQLIEQNQLMNAKLHLAKQFLYRSVSTQTEPEQAGDSEVEDSRKRIHSELNEFLKDIQSNSQDYVYDQSTNTYYSQSTGWFYYPANSAFYNPQSQSYYSYDPTTKKYNFLYKLNDKKRKKVKVIDKKKIEEVIDLVSDGECSEKEEGEIDDADPKASLQEELESAGSSEDGQAEGTVSRGVIESRPLLRTRLEETHHSTVLNSIAPVRLIVQKSASLDVGSLVMVTCLGGKVGQHPQCTVTVPDLTISQLHSEISYDHQRAIYTIQDLISRNGTYLNDTRLKPLERNPLFHGDIIRLADCCQLVAHIHQHRDFTCGQCEPGNTVGQTGSGPLTPPAPTTSHRSNLRSLKKKYGLGNGKSEEGSVLPQGYTDRAAQRQREVGSDNPYEKTAAGSALDLPLDERNKGFRILAKMGWKSGTALGRQAGSLTEPIDFELKDTRHGLGFKH